MNAERNSFDPDVAISKAFEAAGITIASLERRTFPGETIFVVKVHEDDFLRGIEIGNVLDF